MIKHIQCHIFSSTTVQHAKKISGADVNCKSVSSQTLIEDTNEKVSYFKERFCRLQSL